MQELILVVDDEPKIVRIARDYLEKNGYRVIAANDGLSALAAFRRDKPDLVILDLLLPGMDGREVCRVLRQESNTPVIMLTALSEEADQVLGLELGADDYITKPFSPRLLVARVRSALRRAQGVVMPPAVIRSGDLEIDLQAYTVQQKGKDLHLTPNEFKLLVALARHPGQTLTRQQLGDELHGGALSGYDRSVDSHIKNLRRKLEAGDRLVEAVYGVGYRFLEQE